MQPSEHVDNSRLLEMEMDPAVLQGGAREQWEAISDLDAFFTRVYTYFHEKGLRCILASRIISLLMLAFTIVLTVWLVECLNWHGLLYDCKDEASCAAVPLHRDDALQHPSPFLAMFFVLFTLYWFWSLAHFVWNIVPLLEMRTFFREKLHIGDADLQVLSWDTVVQRIVELQRTVRLCIVKDQLTAHDIANRILRKENFMIAFVNRMLLPLQVLPLNMMTKTLEWNLQVCILDAMFDRHFRIRQSFTQDVRGLQRRLVVCGVLNLLLFPFIAAFMLIFFFLKHAEEFHRSPGASAFSRDYSREARWIMREFNELPHIFEARILMSTKDADAYVQQFPTPLLTLFARFVTFIVGSMTAILLVLPLLNESVLIFYRIPSGTTQGDPSSRGFNLLWWLAMASTIQAISRRFSAQPPMTLQPDALLQSVARHTHYMPEAWRNYGHKRRVYREFGRLYQYRVLLLMQEILGCLTTPLLLCFAMPQRAEEILAFVRSFTVHVDGVGHVCGFAMFDFERHGDSQWGAPAEGEQPQLRSCDGKMEKAYLNFKAHHPSWKDEPGEGLLSNIAPATEGLQQLQMPAEMGASDSVGGGARSATVVAVDSSLGSSQLLMLARSSQLFDDLRSSDAIGTMKLGGEASAMLQSEMLAAELYEKMDHFYLNSSNTSASRRVASSRARQAHSQPDCAETAAAVFDPL